MVAAHLLFYTVITIIWLILILVYRNPGLIILFLIYLLLFYRTIVLGLRLIPSAIQLATTGDYTVFKEISRLIYPKVDWTEKGNSIFAGEKVIYVVNYPGNCLEYFAFGLFENIMVVARDPDSMGWKGKLSGVIFQKGNYIPVDGCTGNYQKVKAQIKNHIQNKSIFVYPEKISTRRHQYDLGLFQSGIFRIASELGIRVVPIVIDHLRHQYGSIVRCPLQIHVGSPYTITENGNEHETIHKWMAITLKGLKQ